MKVKAKILAMVLIALVIGQTNSLAGSMMYWTDMSTKKIQRANLDGSGLTNLITTGLGRPYDLALDTAAGKMYWTDSGLDSIQRANLDGSHIEALVTTGLGSPKGIALDLEAGKMYWADSITHKIQRANLNGSGIEDLVTTGLQWPQSIALDIDGGKMYWTDAGTAKIQRANLDGSGVEDLITFTFGLGALQGIALDLYAGKMYWADLIKIQRANLDGSSVEFLVTTGGRLRGIALDVAASKMYWTDTLWYGKIQCANLDGSGVKDLVAGGMIFPVGLALDVPIPKPVIIFVDIGAPLGGDGSCWEMAFRHLQDALAAAQRGDEIRVAQGIYKPDQGTGVTSGDREATFQLKKCVIIEGGYAGFGEPDPDARDIELYENILSGDLADNDRDVNDPYDLLSDPCRADNSYHVVTGSATDATVVLDGFTITGGNANSYPDNTGGGIYNEYGCLTITNCTFTKNSANSGGGGMYNYQSNPTLTNCTFSKNSGHDGGGMHNKTSNPLLNNCVFSKNTAGVGAGIYNNIGSSPVITNCVFSRNSAPNGSGGAIYNGSDNAISNPFLTNCIFVANSASFGGGITNSGSSPTLSNCVFSGNSVQRCGGGMYNVSSGSHPIVTNCTFIGNLANYEGGGMYSSVKWYPPSNPRITNCIFWGNIDRMGTRTDEPAQIHGYSFVNYSCIQGWTGYLEGTGNFGSNPMFADTYGPDNVLGTEDDNLRLLPASPCIDAGDNSAIPPSVVTDLDGDPRIKNATVDIGVYESPKKIFLLNPKPVNVPEGQTATFTIALAMDPLEPIETTVTFRSGDQDISIVTGGIMSFDSSNYSEPQTVKLSAAEDIDYLNGEALIWISAPGFFTAGCVATEADNETVPTILYVDVDTDTDGDNQGRNWADAFTELQDALRIAAKYPQVEEVHVAQGVYTPAEPFSDDREATFQLASGTAIKGGYAGVDEPDPNARDIEAYETILSGDLDGNDVDVSDPRELLDEPTRAENSSHVVTGIGTDATAVLDGFTITGGNAKDEGGGMYNEYGNPTLYNCTFSNNSALEYGGGMANRSSSPVLTNCTFINNSGSEGGGIFCYESSLTLTNCTFSGNSTNEGSGPPSPPPPTILSGSSMFIDYALSNNIASAGLTGSGGGIECSKSSATLTNCTFTGNLAGNGGGIHTFDTSLELANCIFSGNLAEYGGGILNGQSIGRLTNCTFIGNRATHGGGMVNTFSSTVLNNCKFNENLSTYDGGAVYNVACSPTFMNCMFKGNAACNGGGMVNASSSPILKNCTFSNNSAENGGGMCNYIIIGPAGFDQSNPTLTNCIFIMNFASENGGGIHNNDKSHPTLTNCILWDDTPEEIYDDDSTTVVTYSNVQGGWGGEGNIDADPCFVEPGYWADVNDPNILVEPDDPNAVWINGDYHLLPGSPCIDAGDPNYVPEPNETDLDGWPRVINGRIDMGAYEAPIFAEARIVPNTIILRSKGKWITAFIRLPEDYNVTDIDPNSVFLEEQIKAEQLLVNEQEQVAIAKFRREYVQSILNVGEVELTITGNFIDGIPFEATNTIKVIDIGGGKKK